LAQQIGVMSVDLELWVRPCIRVEKFTSQNDFGLWRLKMSPSGIAGFGGGS